MKQNCKKCSDEFTLDQDDLSFYEKMKVPAPVVCPTCRFKMRAVWRNETTLYSGRKCELCGKGVISMYNPKSPYIIYCNDCWMSDKWDSNSYAVDYDRNKPFFVQLDELLKKVPKAATYRSTGTGPNINSEYTNFAGGNKNGYLLFNSGPETEDCAYSRGLSACKEIMDGYMVHGSDRVYDSVNVQKCSNVSWSKNVAECIDSSFLIDCFACQDCFGCVNLRHKSYHFLNEPLSREEYRKKVDEIVGSYKKIEEFKKVFQEFSLKFPRKENNNLKSINCEGDYITESKDCQNCLEISFCENTRNSFSAKFSKDCYDVLGHGRKAELMLEVVGSGVGQKVLGSWFIENSHDVEYSFAVKASEYCIGCDGIKNGKYCILNKQYSKEEYEDLRNHIINELREQKLYGLFFPSEMALFAYNESIAQDNFPLTKEEALAEGFMWEDDVQKTEGKGTIDIQNLPDTIKDVGGDQVLSEVLSCIECNRNYKITAQELLFYRKMNIPLPHKCFYCRHKDRLVRRGPYKFWDRNCAKCNKEIHTNYAPDRPEIVYCEKCYQQEVY